MSEYHDCNSCRWHKDDYPYCCLPAPAYLQPGNVAADGCRRWARRQPIVEKYEEGAETGS